MRDLLAVSSFETSSEVSMEAVPTSTGCPLCAVSDVVDDGAVLLFLGQVDQIAAIVADHRLIGRDDHDLQPVDLLELGRLGVGRAGHAGQLVVQPEVVLEGDRGQVWFSFGCGRFPWPPPPGAGRRCSAGPAWCGR
jgi:hypothetical protein